MRAGELRHRVTIEALTRTKEAGGGSTEAWLPLVANVPARVTAASSRETYVAEHLSARVTHSVKMRYRDGLIPTKHRLLWGSKVLDIQSVIPVGGLRVELRLLCEETK